MQVQIKKLFDYLKEEDLPMLFPDNSGVYPVSYPTIEGNTSNFLTDYTADYEFFDHDFVHRFGERYIDLPYSDTLDSDAISEYYHEIYSILRVFIDSWARLYYALSIDFNPIYNVEEHTTTTYGQHVTDTDLGQRQHTEGNKSQTLGTGTDTSTAEKWAYDSLAFVNEAKQTDVTGSRTNTEASYTNTEAATKDTVTSKQHVDSVDRSGNIGTVSATDLLKREYELRRRLSFWDNLFTVIAEELGAYYECDSIL